MSLLRALDLAGVAVFAISGALLAGRRSLDLLGVFVIAALTAVGGGTLRDLLLDRQIFWLHDPAYLGVIALATVGTVIYGRWWRPARPAPLERALLVADALGLGLFTISGAQIAERVPLIAPSIVLMGAMTGVAGGVLRDVVCGEIPLVLRRDIYATAAIAGAACYVVLKVLGVPAGAAALIGAGAVVALRLAAILGDLHLPVFTLTPTAPRDDDAGPRPPA